MGHKPNTTPNTPSLAEWAQVQKHYKLFPYQIKILENIKKEAKMTKISIDKLKNRAVAKNALNEYLNNTVPKILTYLKKGYTCIKNDTELSKKDKTATNIILVTGRPKAIRSRIEVDKYAIKILSDINYQVGNFSFSYIHEYDYIVDQGYGVQKILQVRIQTNGVHKKIFRKRRAKTSCLIK